MQHLFEFDFFNSVSPTAALSVGDSQSNAEPINIASKTGNISGSDISINSKSGRNTHHRNHN